MTINRRLMRNRYRIMPDRRTVTYYVQQADQSFASGVPVSDVEKKPLKFADKVAGDIHAATTSSVWAFWRDKLDSITPKQGDKFDDDESNTWTVQSVEEKLLQQRYRCICVRHQ